MSQHPAFDPPSSVTISETPDLERRKRRAERRAHLRHFRKDAQWWLIGGAAVLAAILGWTGFRNTHVTGFGDATYLTLQLFTLESGKDDHGQLFLQVARFLAPAVMAVALVRATVGLFHDQAQLLRLRVIRDHIVVCGVGRTGHALARSLREQGYRVVAIDQDAEDDMVGSCRSAGIPVLIGDATDIDVLRKAGVGRAAFIVALCGQSGTNAQIAVIADRLAKGRRRSLSCLAQVLEPDLCSLLRTKFPAAGAHPAFRLEFFDIYERAARVMLQRHPAFADTDTDTDTDRDRQPHLLIIGFGRLGQSLALQAARNWKSGKHAPERRLLITVVDARAAQEVRALRARHPELDTVCRIKPTDIYDERETPQVTLAYVCLGDDAHALHAGLAIHEQLKGQGATVVIRGRTVEGLPALLHATQGRFTGLYGFALLDQTCDAELLFGGFNESLAQLLHARYLRVREAQGWTYDAQRDIERRTHPALASWPQLAEDYKDSNRDQAVHTWEKLAAVRCDLVDLVGWDTEPFPFTDHEVEKLARLEHERWMARERRKKGRAWVLGRRPHPDLIPWEQLTVQEQDIDREFVRELPQVLAQLGCRIVRQPS